MREGGGTLTSLGGQGSLVRRDNELNFEGWERGHQVEEERTEHAEIWRWGKSGAGILGKWQRLQKREHGLHGEARLLSAGLDGGVTTLGL